MKQGFWSIDVFLQVEVGIDTYEMNCMVQMFVCILNNLVSGGRHSLRGGCSDNLLWNITRIFSKKKPYIF